MSDDGEVPIERDGPVVTLTFARESARNAMTWKMYDEFGAACDELAEDRSARVVILRGEGEKAFVAGTDMSHFESFATGQDGIDYEVQVGAIIDKYEQLPQATIAVVRGYAVGGGMMLAAVSDLRLCDPTARFGIPVARTLGNCLSVKSYARLIALFGPSRAKALVFTAGFLDADDALAVGFATEVVQAEALDERVEELAQQLVSHAPLSMWATKEAIRRVTLHDLPDIDDIIGRVYASRDFREGHEAFLEKRQADWRSE